jgi:conjugal transfer pilus assembly protein TraB
VIGSALGGVVGVAALVSNGAGIKPASSDDVISTVLTDKNTREISLGSLDKRVSDMEKSRQELDQQRDRVDQAVKDMAAATSNISKRVDNVTTDLDALVHEMEATRTELGLQAHTIDQVRHDLKYGSRDKVAERAQLVQPTAQPNPERESLDPRSLFSGTGALDTGQMPRLTAPPASSQQGYLQNSSYAAPARPMMDGGGTLRRISDARPHPKSPAPSLTHDEGMYLPTGAVITGELLNGVDAPTGEQSRHDQMPVLLRIDADAILPNRYKENFRDCFVILTSYGDLGSERAYMRAQAISCIDSSGAAIESDLKAYAVGEDGKVGVKGRLISKQGQFIARSLMIGIMQGVAEGLSQNQTSTIGFDQASGQLQSTASNQPIGSAVLRGTGSALDRIANYYLKLADQTFPVVDIDSGRMIDIIVESGTKLNFKGS